MRALSGLRVAKSVLACHEGTEGRRSSEREHARDRRDSSRDHYERVKQIKKRNKDPLISDLGEESLDQLGISRANTDFGGCAAPSLATPRDDGASGSGGRRCRGLKLQELKGSRAKSHPRSSRSPANVRLLGGSPAMVDLMRELRTKAGGCVRDDDGGRSQELERNTQLLSTRPPRHQLNH